MRALLPPGKLWRMFASTMADFFLACAQELARVDARADTLIEEADPRTTTELLPDFETDLGLIASGTVADRRARVIALLLRRQRVRNVDYQQALAPLLQQAAVDVVILETSHAQALTMGDPREIYRFFIYRNPALPGTADIVAAQALVDQMSHSHTNGHVIQSISFLCDSALSLCDRDRLGV